MLLPNNVLYRIAFLAWGVAFLVLRLPGRIKHDLAVSLYGCVSFTESAYAKTLLFNQTVFWGLAVGFFVFGILCDYLGRFRILLWTLLLAPGFSTLSGLSFFGYDFLLFRFLAGIAVGGMLLSCGILVAETRPASLRAKAIIAILLGAAASPFLALLLEKLVYSLPFLPYSPWRSFLLLHIFLIGSFFYARRFYDEPIRWKQRVRDEMLSEQSSRRFAAFAHLNWSNIFVLTLFLFALIFGLRAVFIQSDKIVRLSALAAFDRQTKTRTPFDAALLACIVRYPQLLGMKEIETLNLDEMPERFQNARCSENNLPNYLAKAVLELHRKEEEINVISLIDQAMEQRNREMNPSRSTSEIPLYDLKYYAKTTSDYLTIGNRALNSMKILPTDPTLTKAALWQQRFSVVKTLWNGLQEQIRQRFCYSEQQQTIFKSLFFFGGLLALAALYLSRETSTVRIRNLCLLLLVTVLCSFVPMPGSRYLIQSHYFAPFLGIIAFLLVRGVLLALPALFKTSVRGTSLGICLLFAGLLASVALPDSSVNQHMLNKLLKELILFYLLFFFLLLPFVRFRFRNKKATAQN